MGAEDSCPTVLRTEDGTSDNRKPVGLTSREVAMWVKRAAGPGDGWAEKRAGGSENTG